jgi:superfamily II DNA helicase RecQ
VCHTRDPHADFRSKEQLLTLQFLARNTVDIAIVQLTGSGKSLLYLLLGRLQALRITVIILPLLAVSQDVAPCCEQHQVPFAQWSSMEGNWHLPNAGGTTLLLASVEQATSLQFLAFMLRLQQQEELGRDIFHKAHLGLT